MKKRLLDVLVCPYDKTNPLILHIFQERNIEDITLPKASDETKVVCQYYCGNKKLKLIDETGKESRVLADNIKKIKYDSDCLECFKKEIVAGLLECSHCNTFYPIISDIPIMVKAELRNEEIYKEFTEKWADNIKQLTTKK